MRKILVALLLTLTLLAGGLPARADDASLGRLGEGVYPLQEGVVELSQEQVELVVTPEATRIDVLFVFTNPGAEKLELLLGFPEGMPSDPEREEFQDDFTLYDFRAFVDGKEVEVERRDGVNPPQDMVHGEVVSGLPPYSAWYTFSLSLEAGEKVTVRNTYRVKNTRWSNGEVETGYILKTGALWAGPINNVQVKARLEGIRPDQVLGARPGNWTTARGDAGVYKWEFSDWEPDSDIVLHFSARPSLAFWQDLPIIDKLLEAGQYEQALKEIAETNTGVALTEEKGQLLAFREAYALQMAGETDAAEALWEKLLYSAAKDEPRDGSYRVADDPAAYYYLAEIYLQKNDFDAMQGLYDEIRYYRVNFDILDKGEAVPPPAEKQPVLKPSLVKAGKASIIGSLQQMNGDRYRLEAGNGLILEFAGSEVPKSTGNLYLVTGNWQGDSFEISRMVSLAGDLKSREAELAPYLVRALPVSLLLDNRGVEYASPPVQQKVEFRSQPLVLNGHLLVDMLEVAEMLDVSLGYHPGSRVITLEGRARPLKLGIEDNIYSGAGVGRYRDTAVIRYDGRVYLPLRFVLEHYGYQVDYDAGQRLVKAHGF